MLSAKADKWIAALRSGKYLQGTGCLCREGKLCCLGVLCDISGKGGWDDSTEADNLSSGIKDYVITDTAERMYELIDLCKDGFGIKTGAGWIPAEYLDLHGNKTSLAAMNDGGCTFDQIADLIDYFRDEL